MTVDTPTRSETFPRSEEPHPKANGLATPPPLPRAPPVAALRRSLSSTFSLLPGCPEPPRPHPRPGPGPAWGQVLVVLPTLWIAAWLWLFWKSIRWPLNALARLLELLSPGPGPGPGSGSRRPGARTVLVSGGGSIQALHLARNLHCAGAKVVAFECEGQFGLAKFSMAVDAFYTVARPTAASARSYADALRDIVLREGVTHYVPVCSGSSAYFDALAKPHLEALGCSCFVPDLEDVAVLDDIAEVMRLCRAMGEPTPPCATLTDRAAVDAWYDEAPRAAERHFMASTGRNGIRERVKFIVPPRREDFRLSHRIGDETPWIIVGDGDGDHFLTCTTVKRSRVVANVTCKIHPENRGLSQECDREIDAWLSKFFARLAADGSAGVTGHVAFRFVRERATGTVLPLGAKVGVSLPYICHTSAHPRLLWKTCSHAPPGRQPSCPGIEPVSGPPAHPGVEAVTRLIGSVLDKREALFAYWDPLPYCAYYHLRLPFADVLAYVHDRNRNRTRC